MPADCYDREADKISYTSIITNSIREMKGGELQPCVAAGDTRDSAARPTLPTSSRREELARKQSESHQDRSTGCARPKGNENGFHTSKND
jgi:hypothetical protein